MSKKIKRILSIDDLENFYSKYKRSTHFSSKESGYQLAVQVPATFEKDDTEDDTLLYCKARFFHIGVNRNKSNVTKEAAEKAMKTMAYKPVLANFCEIEKDGDTIRDFTAHDMLIEDGEIVYLEHQIGCITADECWFEDYEGKTYICGYVAIPRNYTDAVDIIERKNGTKVSVELLINELSYDAKQKCMMLTDVIVSGLTCLGTSPETGRTVEEGMVNSRLDIRDFSEKNNSMFSSISEEDKTKLIEMRDTIENMMSRFNINDNQGKEEESLMDEKMNVEEVMETEEVEITETEEVTETETESEVEEVVETEEEEVSTEEQVTETAENESEEEVEETPDVVEENAEVIETEAEKEDDEDNKENCAESTEDDKDSDDEEDDKEKFTKEFALSHDDVRCALYSLIEKYEGTNNDYYWIVSVYDNSVVYQSCCTGAYYGHKYSKDGDNVALEGEPYALFAEFLTESEKAELESMRANYSSISEKLAAYELAEELAEKATVFEDAAYAEYLQTKEFKTLMSEDSMKQFSKEELEDKANAALGKLVKSTKTFALKDETVVERKPVFFAFAAKNTESSFLDGLLKK